MIIKHKFVSPKENTNNNLRFILSTNLSIIISLASVRYLIIISFIWPHLFIFTAAVINFVD
jgi:hypothetical protein